MLPASYVRLGGVQSEVSKVTITRVANSEVQYRRKIDSYRRDMNINISGIKREQVFLRRSMLRYHKKIRQHKLQKEEAMKKENESNLAESNMMKIVTIKKVGMETMEGEIERTKETENDDDTDAETVLSKENRKEFDEDEEVSKDEDLDLENKRIENTTELEEHVMPRKSKKYGQQTLKHGRSSVRFNSLKPLPAIAEGDEKENERVGQTVKNKLTRTDSQFYLSQFKRRKKKENVSYSDLIKLQHSSSNTKMLFKLVDKLAYKSWANEKRDIIPDIRDHVHFRGESPAFASSITKTAAVLYPIRYGYAAGSETFPEQHSEKEILTSNRQVNADINESTTLALQPLSRVISHNDTHTSDNDIQNAVHHGNSYVLGTTAHLSNSQPKQKRLLSFPELVQEVRRIKSLEKHGRSSRNQSPTRRISRSNSITSVERAQIDRNEMQDKQSRYKVAWQSALAKIKTVHTLMNFTGMF